MSRIRLDLKATVGSRGEASAHLKQPGDAVLVERGVPRWLIMACPCGCGEELPVNLDGRAGPAWRMFQTKLSGLTLYPSVWRDTGCESHFIIWRNNIFLFGGYDNEDEWLWDDQFFNELRQAVLERLPRDGLVHFSEIADDLGEIPWDVQRVCRQLVHQGKAVEGKGKQRGQFRRS